MISSIHWGKIDSSLACVSGAAVYEKSTRKSREIYQYIPLVN
jgi:hypothetical protein